MAAAMSSSKLLPLLSVFLVAFLSILVSASDSAYHVNFVLVGATGSLAKKYLWQGLYDVYATDPAVPIRIYGGARADPQKVRQQIDDILDGNVKYDLPNDRLAFGEQVHHVQLKTLEQYESFCRDTLNGGSQHDLWSGDGSSGGGETGHCHAASASDKSDCTDPASREVGRIFYLAVPPYSYAEMAGWLHSVCRPKDPSAWIRVVLEKPYGTDVETVESLVRRLKVNFAPSELYLIDHYLGKAAAQHILPLRLANNKTLEGFLNNQFVERIEVVVKESEDADGRMAFYDSYGVFLDILQNHAMEMLTLIAMDLPSNLSDAAGVRRRKAAFLASALPVHPDQVVAAQYADYIRHGRAEFKDDTFRSGTPTFGAVLLHSSGRRWSGVDMILLSGKALDAKSSYLRVVFKDNRLTLGAPGSPPEELVVSFGPRWPGCERTGPCLVVPKVVLSGAALTSSWSVQGETSDGRSVVLFPGDKEDRAYSVVISDLVHGRHENFVSVDSLSASWNLWSLALARLKTLTDPPLYDQGDVDRLAIRLTPDGLAFTDPAMNPAGIITGRDVPGPVVLGVPVDEVVVLPWLDLMVAMADRLLLESERVVAARPLFHLAVPGGRTPRPLFQLLAGQRRFPWDRTHIWFTDERCVPEDHPHSNYGGALTDLLRHVPVLAHPMPVQLSRGLCDPSDRGAELYTALLKRSAGGEAGDGSGVLDVVVLGVGGDGHVASLFPGATSPVQGEGLVELVEPPSGVVPAVRRMSLTAEAIGAARKVFVVVTGKDKHGVVEEILRGKLPMSKFPVKGVRASEGVTLFIDEAAYVG